MYDTFETIFMFRNKDISPVSIENIALEKHKNWEKSWCRIIVSNFLFISWPKESKWITLWLEATKCFFCQMYSGCIATFGSKFLPLLIALHRRLENSNNTSTLMSFSPFLQAFSAHKSLPPSLLHDLRSVPATELYLIKLSGFVDEYIAVLK